MIVLHGKFEILAVSPDCGKGGCVWPPVSAEWPSKNFTWRPKKSIGMKEGEDVGISSISVQLFEAHKIIFYQYCYGKNIISHRPHNVKEKFLINCMIFSFVSLGKLNETPRISAPPQ